MGLVRQAHHRRIPSYKTEGADSCQEELQGLKPVLQDFGYSLTMPLPLLHLLRGHRGGWLTMEALQVALELSPGEILGQLEKLSEMGHKLEKSPAYGFRLAEPVAKLTAELIEYGLQTNYIGRKILVYESTDSTNDVVWHYAKEVDYDGLAVFGEYQRKGRGRFQRRWEAKAGSSILCSVLLQKISRSEAGKQSSTAGLTLLTGLAVAQAIEDVCPVRGRIKWPNDVMVGGKKLAGIMVESRKINGGPAYVLGIGINCLQEDEDFDEEIRGGAVSLRQILKSKADIDRLQLAQQLLYRLDQGVVAWENNQTDTLHEQWLAHCDDLGQRLKLAQNGKTYAGRVIEVSIERGLILQLDDGAIHIFDPATTTVVA